MAGKKNFSIKDLGEATYVLGIHISIDRSNRLFKLSQSIYIDTIVKNFWHRELQEGFILMRHNIHIAKEKSPKTPKDRALMEKIVYALMIGSCMLVNGEEEQKL